MKIFTLANCLAAALSLSLVAAAAADGKLLSLSKAGNTLHIFDAGTYEELESFPVGTGPHEVVTDASGRFAYVSNYGNQQPGNTISVIDLEKSETVATIDLGELGRPHGLCEHDGKIYFTSEVAQSVGRIDVATNKLDWSARTGRGGTHMLVVSPKTGEIFTADIGGGTVTVIDPKVGGEAGVTHIAVPGKPEGIAISPDGKFIAVGDNDGGTITIIDAGSKEVTGAIEAGGMPIRVGFTPDGTKLIATDPPAGVLRVFDFAKRQKIGEVDVGKAPIGFVVNPANGAVLVSMSEAGEVAVVDLEKLAVIQRIETGPVPDGIALVFPKNGARAAADRPDQPQEPEMPAVPAGQKPRLGVAVQSAGAGGGVEIIQVIEGSLAQKLGLRQGDVIMTIDGKASDDPQEFADAIYAAAPGKTLKLVIIRDDQEHEFDVKLE